MFVSNDKITGHLTDNVGVKDLQDFVEMVLLPEEILKFVCDVGLDAKLVALQVARVMRAHKAIKKGIEEKDARQAKCGRDEDPKSAAAEGRLGQSSCRVLAKASCQLAVEFVAERPASVESVARVHDPPVHNAERVEGGRRQRPRCRGSATFKTESEMANWRPICPDFDKGTCTADPCAKGMRVCTSCEKGTGRAG